MRLAAALLLIALPALAQDAGTDPAEEAWDAIPVYRAVIDVELVDGGMGARLLVSGGGWLNDAAFQGSAAELESKRARVAYLEEHAGDVPYRWILGAAAVGVAIGAGSVVGLECGYGACFGLRKR